MLAGRILAVMMSKVCSIVNEASSSKLIASITWCLFKLDPIHFENVTESKQNNCASARSLSLLRW